MENNDPWVRLEAASRTGMGDKLITLVIKLPKFCDPQLQKHRNLSKNASSDRAIPIKTQLERLVEKPFIPPILTKNQKGMSGSKLISTAAYAATEIKLLELLNHTSGVVAELAADYDIHKQHLNRYLEAFIWQEHVVTGNPEWFWDFVRQRNQVNGEGIAKTQPEMQRVGSEINYILEELESDYAKNYEYLAQGHWHTPFLSTTEKAQLRATAFYEQERFEYDDSTVFDPKCKQSWLAVSVARNARVSYLNHKGKRDYAVDMALFTKLKTEFHMSPFEHVARPLQWGDKGIYFRDGACYSNNFKGFTQFRALI